ncbi:MAG: hypothetical protein RR456_02335 [Victivallaceae bacterium]
MKFNFNLYLLFIILSISSFCKIFCTVPTESLKENFIGTLAQSTIVYSVKKPLLLKSKIFPVVSGLGLSVIGLIEEEKYQAPITSCGTGFCGCSLCEVSDREFLSDIQWEIHEKELA